MKPALGVAVVAVLLVVAVLVARLLVTPLGVAPWLAEAVALLLLVLAFLAGVALRRRRG